MAEIKSPAHVFIDITPDELLANVMTLKNNKLRLSQICCAYSNEKLEVLYSFADDNTNDYINLRLTIDKDTDELTAWSIKVTNMTTKKELTNNFTVNKGVASVSDGTFDEPKVMNIQLIALPSTGGIGTTIFTVAGCGIMIAAAFFFFAGRKKEN